MAMSMTILIHCKTMMQVFITDPQVLAKQITTLLKTAITNTLISILYTFY